MPIPQFCASGAALVRASPNSSTLVAECAAVEERVSLIFPRSETFSPNSFIVFVRMSAPMAKSMLLAWANSKFLLSAAVASAADRPLRVRFSNALAASVALYLVFAPILMASSRIFLKSAEAALDTAFTRAIASSNERPALTMDVKNEPRPSPMPRLPKVEVMELFSFLKVFCTCCAPLLTPWVSRLMAMDRLSFAISLPYF